MIITVINEPRSGSHSFVHWIENGDGTFEYRKKFDTIWGIAQYNITDNFIPKNIETEHLILSYNHLAGNDYRKLIQVSDKCIFLYRENEKEQIESWVAAKRSSDFQRLYVYKEINDLINEEQTLYMKQIKKEFSELYLSNSNYFCISYEDLFYRKGIKRVVDYLNIDGLTENGFPCGLKLRQNIINNKKEII